MYSFILHIYQLCQFLAGLLQQPETSYCGPVTFPYPLVSYLHYAKQI